MGRLRFFAREVGPQVDPIEIRRRSPTCRREGGGGYIEGDHGLVINFPRGQFAGPGDKEGNAHSTFEKLALVSAQRGVVTRVVGQKRLLAGATVVAEEKDQRVLVSSSFPQMRGEPPDVVIQTDEQGEITPAFRVRNRGGDAIPILFQNLQRRVHGVIGEVEKPWLFRVAGHERHGLVGKKVGGIAVVFLQIAAPVNHVAGIGGLESWLSVLVQNEIMHRHQKAEIVVEPPRLRHIGGTKSQVPLPY